MKINLLGIPFNSDGTSSEIENPARALREYGLVQLLSKILFVHDYGDMTIRKPMDIKIQKPVF